MDILTHASFGAIASRAAFQQKIGKKTYFLGACASILPDLDFIFRFSKNEALNLLLHRAWAHSLIVLPLWTFFWAFIFSYLWKKLRKEKIPFFPLWGIFLFSFLLHIFLDSLNSYGIFLFWPLSEKRFYGDLLTVFNPLFSVPILTFTFLSFFHHFKRYFLLMGGYIFLYLVFVFALHYQVVSEQEKIIFGRGEIKENSRVTPLTMNPFFWRSVYTSSERVILDDVWIYPFQDSLWKNKKELPLAKKGGLKTTFLTEELFKESFDDFFKFADGFVVYFPSSKEGGQALSDVRRILDLTKMESRLQLEFYPEDVRRPLKIYRR